MKKKGRHNASRYGLLALLLFGLLILGSSIQPRTALACSCYNTQGEETAVDPGPSYCVSACGNDMLATAIEQNDCTFGDPNCEFTSGYCICSEPATPTFTCENVCIDAGLDNEPPASAATTTPAATQSNPKLLLTPNLAIDIPTVKFTDAVESDGVLRINYLGDYIAGVYKWLIGVSTLIAIVMIMVSGLQYAISKEAEAKKRIQNAVTGLILLMSTYLILATVNPRLVIFEPLELTTILTIKEEEDDVVNGGSVVTSFKAPSASNVTGDGKNQVPKELAGDIDDAAEILASQGYGMSISSSFRTVEKQQELIRDNCKNPPGSATCDPKPGRPTTCILKGNNAANCPHTTGRALDIWATKDGATCVSQSQCSADESKDQCRKDKCQAALIDAMKSAGFCNLSVEAWHFEKPKMSTRCN